MSRARIATAALFAVALGAFALHTGCSSDDEPECSSDRNCSSATTACTKGVCNGGKCEAQPVADGTRVADQSSVAGKPCVKLECKAGRATEVNDSTKTPPEVACQKQTCENMAPKVENVLDGVPCMSSMGACQGGMCVLSDSGPIGMPDTAPTETSVDDAESDAGSETESDAATD
jgi:hypothetical protein